MPKKYICAITGDLVHKPDSYRFVKSPDGRICFDPDFKLASSIARKSDGQGSNNQACNQVLIVSSSDDIVNSWLNETFLDNHFGIKVDKEHLLTQVLTYFHDKMLTFIAFAKKSGKLQLGHSQVEEFLKIHSKNSVIIQASDASKREGFENAGIPVISIFSCDDLSQKLGKEMVKYIVIYGSFVAPLLDLERKYKFFNELK